MAQKTRRQFITQCSTAAAAATLPGCARNRFIGGQERGLNVVVLMSDEHNPKYSAAYGHPLSETPNMNRMAERGTLFENAYCPSPLCMPSRSAFVSGLYTHENQCYNNSNVFQQDYLSYGAALARQGAHTVHIGKMDVYAPSEALGFSEIHLPIDRQPPGDPNVRRHPIAIREGDGPVRAAGWGPKDDPYGFDDAVVAEGVRWLRERPASLDAPFTLCLNVNAPHFPHFTTPALWEKYAEGATLPEHGREAATAQHPYVRDLQDHFETRQFTEEQVRGLRRGYFGNVEYVDLLLGKLIDVLDEEGLSEDTLLVYASDHGEMLGKFGMWWKCSVLEDSARVPLLVMGPGFEAGRRVSTPVSLLDLQATLFAATGAQRPRRWRGESLDLIAEDDPERALFAEYHGHGVRGSAYLIRKGAWKLIWCAEAPHQLFDLERDPEELTNVAEEQPEKLAELEGELRAICDPEAENHRAHEYVKRQLEAMEVSA